MLSVQTKLLAAVAAATLGIPIEYVDVLLRRELDSIRRISKTITLDYSHPVDVVWLRKHALPWSQRILLMLGVVVFARTVVSVIADVLRLHNSTSRI
jgi:alkylhydroperoxidase/carboxymuconolactone decarboxylase family protein YurZ